jgi:hypothetical protein
MATQKQSIVTPERFAQGLTYEDWLATIDRNQERFQENYEGIELSEEDVRAFRELAGKPDGPARCLVLAEPWCPDVFRGLPVMARIAEAAGIELRILPRDQNKDVMAEFLRHGEHESIPTFIFYTRDDRYICHWSERPALADEQMEELTGLTAPLRDANASQEERQRAVQAYLDFQKSPTWANWRQETVRELRGLLEKRAA